MACPGESTLSPEPAMTARPPLADQRPTRRVLHGVEIVDDYAWLRDDDWQQVMRDPAVLKPEIRAYLEAENAYTKAVLAPTEGLQAVLFEELKGRHKEADDSVPARDGAFAYFSRYVEGGQHPLFCRQRAEGAGAEVLLDGNAAATGLPFFRVHGAEHSPDHRYFAYAVDANGSETCEIAIRDMIGGGLLDERLPEASGDIVWANDSRHFFYVVLDRHHRPCKVLRHRLGTAADDDVIVYEEADPGFFVSLDKSESRRFILIEAHDHTTSEVWLIDAERPERAPRLVEARRRDVKYQIADDAPRRRFLILTNAEEAEDFKLMAAPDEAPGRANWREVVPHAPGTLRLDLLLFADHLVLLERHAGLPRLQVLRLSDGGSHGIAFEEPAYALALLPGYEYETTSLRFVYSSLTTPPRTYDYDLDQRSRVLRKEQEVPSGHDREAYLSERLLAPAEDGAEVPISLLYRKDTALDGSAPVLLYGYGAYGHAVPAGFQPNRFSLVDRGFVYAIAHVRGGTDKGWAWYRQGKLAEKPNTFGDTIACARHLVARGYATAGGIALHGGSAGGLLVGAVVNRAPELFKAAVAEVPFVDVLTTMCDDTLPLTPPEWPEWGNPLADRAAFEVIRSYSPYDNVGAQAYPHILATAGLTDPRVTYWEPAKWVAKLRASKMDDRLLLLRTYMEAGHGGASGRFDKLTEVALAYAFLLLVFGKAD
jgi:oligopeptidase B